MFALKRTEFIDIVNRIADEGVSPYFLAIQHSVSCLIAVEAEIDIRIRQKDFLGRQVMQVITKSGTKLFRLHQKMEDILLISQESIVTEVDASKYLRFF
jgi:DUF1009 family protein